jgi:hypothetical protein
VTVKIESSNFAILPVEVDPGRDLYEAALEGQLEKTVKTVQEIYGKAYADWMADALAAFGVQPAAPSGLSGQPVPPDPPGPIDPPGPPTDPGIRYDAAGNLTHCPCCNTEVKAVVYACYSCYRKYGTAIDRRGGDTFAAHKEHVKLRRLAHGPYANVTPTFAGQPAQVVPIEHGESTPSDPKPPYWYLKDTEAARKLLGIDRGLRGCVEQVDDDDNCCDDDGTPNAPPTPTLTTRSLWDALVATDETLRARLVALGGPNEQARIFDRAFDTNEGGLRHRAEMMLSALTGESLSEFGKVP